MSGPNKDNKTSVIKSVRDRNYFYFEFDCEYVGEYTFYLNNYYNPDETSVVFALNL